MGMEFNDKIMLYYFKEVKCKQGFTTDTWYYLYNALCLTFIMPISGLMASQSEIRCSAAGSFYGGDGTI